MSSSSDGENPSSRDPPSATGDADGDDRTVDDPRLRKRLEQLVPDLVKRTFYAGLGALFTTEEGIRKIATDFALPKDVANYLIHQAGNSKDEVLRIFARELRGFLDNVNLSGEMQKLLTSLSFEIKTEIRFIPNDEAVSGVKPSIKREVSVKRAGKKMKDEGGGPE